MPDNAPRLNPACEIFIPVDEDVALTEVRPGDRDSFVRYLNDRRVSDNTSRIPYPYTERDADAFLRVVAEATREQGRPVIFAVRRNEGELIGCCGIEEFELGTSHRAELGYWLGRPYWGRGIMTKVVGAACAHAFAEFGLEKIAAYVFERNVASSRVLEKCGFVREGTLRRHFQNHGRLLDARLYALFKPAREHPVAQAGPTDGTDSPLQ